MLIFISGAVRSGKSALGESLASALAKDQRKIYLATARHYDREMTKRIRFHQQQRAGKGFLTVERCRDIGQGNAYFNYGQQDTVLLDCLGTLLMNEYFDFTQSNPQIIQDKLVKDILSLKGQVSNLIIISNEVFSDGISYDKPVEEYMKILGGLHIALVQHSDTAIECAYSGYQLHKGDRAIVPAL